MERFKLIFDIETIPDGDIVSRGLYPKESLSNEDALERYRLEQEEDIVKYKKMPYLAVPLQKVVAISAVKINEKDEIIDVIAFDSPEHRGMEMVRQFWKGYEKYNFNIKTPLMQFITYEGRRFDIPVLEQEAFRYGISIKNWFNDEVPSYEQPRNRYNRNAHWDLAETLTNYNTFVMKGGLKVVMSKLGAKSKFQFDGSDVHRLYKEGKIKDISEYCTCDALDTYFLYLRVQTLMGIRSLRDEVTLVIKSRNTLEKYRQKHPIIEQYLTENEEIQGEELLKNQ